MPTTSNMADISAPSINTRTSLVKSAKESSLLFFLKICEEGFCKLFKPKTRNFRLTRDLQLVFKSHQYFMVFKSYFEAFFKTPFYHAVSLRII